MMTFIAISVIVPMNALNSKNPLL